MDSTIWMISAMYNFNLAKTDYMGTHQFVRHCLTNWERNIMNEIVNTNYMNEIADNIVKLVQDAKAQLATSVNSIMTETYWNTGKYIVEVEQDGKATAIYGSKLLTNLSHELTLRMGKGYSRPNLNNMRKFYLRYPNYQTVSDNLSWSHICELITA